MKSAAHVMARIGLAIAIASMTLVGLPSRAEAATSGTCVPYVSPITQDEFTNAWQVYSDINCNRARNVTFRFIMRYTNIGGTYTPHDDRLSWSYKNGAYIHGIRRISSATVRYVYAEVTVCYGSPRRCRSDSSSVGRQ